MLLREGNTRQAIKAYQEEASVSYEAARVQVRALARQHQLPMRQGLVLRLALLTLAGLLALILSG